MNCPFSHDLHAHTNLSLCAPRDSEPEGYLPLLEKEGVKVIGFSNHIYFSPFINHATFYEKSGIDRVRRLRPVLNQLQIANPEVKFRLGCEVELVYGMDPNLLPWDTEGVDYVLLAASHVLNLRQYRGFDLDNPEKMRKLLYERFKYACRLSYPVPTGICHPLYPICSPMEQEVVDGMKEEDLAECFSLAADTGKSIEIHACLWRDGTCLDSDGLSPSYLRLLSVAKACGCKFHFGSDAHTPRAFEKTHRLLYLAAEKLGLGEDDIWEMGK